MSSANLKRAVKRIKATLNANYEQAQVTPTAGPVGTGKAFIGGQVFDANISGVTQVVNVGRPAAAQYAAKVGGGVAVASSGGGGSTSSGGGTGAAITSSFVIADPDALLPNARQLAVSSVMLMTDGGPGGYFTIGMATPGTLSATTTSDSGPMSNSHTHAITASAAPGAAVSLLKTTSAGLLTLPLYAATTSVTTPALLSTGDLTITPSGGDIFANAKLDVITGTSGVTKNSSYDGLAVYAASNAGLQLLTPNTGVGLVTFGDPEDNDVGRILYRHSTNRMDFEAGATLSMTVTNSGVGFGGQTSPAYPVDATGSIRASTSLITPLATVSTKVTTPLVDTASGHLTLQPAASLFLNPTAEVRMSTGKTVQTDNFSSQLTGWRHTYAGELDTRYIYSDQLKIKLFIADLEQALAGSQIISKSVTTLATAFTAPAAGATVDLYVDDLPSAEGMAVFEANDIVLVREYSRAGGGLSVTNCWGTVTGYTDQADKKQKWTFTRSGTNTYTTIAMRGTPQSPASSAASSRTATKPTGTTTDDVLVGVYVHDGSADTITPPSGWVSLGYTSGSDINVGVFYKVAGGSEPSNYAFSTTTSHAAALSVFAYSGVDTTSPVADFAIQANASSTSFAAPAVDAGTTADMLIFVGGVTNNTASTPPASMTEQVDTGATGIRVYMADRLLTASGSYSATATLSSAQANIGALISLRPILTGMSTEAGAMTPGTTVAAGAIVLDFGVSGNGWHETTAIDGAYGSNSPYSRVVNWTTHPATGATVRTQTGNLKGLFSAGNEYGFYAGDGVTDTNAYLRLSNVGSKFNNIPISLYASSEQTVLLTPSLGIDLKAPNPANFADRHAIRFSPTVGSGNSYARIYNLVNNPGLNDQDSALYMTALATGTSSNQVASVRLVASGGGGVDDGEISVSTNMNGGSDTLGTALIKAPYDISLKIGTTEKVNVTASLLTSNVDLDMNGNDIVDIRTLTVAPPAGTSAITLTTPASQSTSMISLSSANNGTGVGPFIEIGRNSNGSTPAAGFLYMAARTGTMVSLWVDNGGTLRMNTGALPSNANDTSGTVVGSQTSSLDTKNIIEPFTDYSSALNAIIDAPLYDFTYKSGAFNNQRFTGIVTDYAPTFGMDRDAEHPHGKSLNEVTAHGYTFAAIKALHNRIEQLENQVEELTHAN